MEGGRSRIGVDVDLGIVLHFFHISSININTHSQCHRTYDRDTLDWEQFDYISV